MQFLKSSFQAHGPSTGISELVGPSLNRVALVLSSDGVGLYTVAPSEMIAVNGLVMNPSSPPVVLHKSVIGDLICAGWSVNSTVAVNFGFIETLLLEGPVSTGSSADLDGEVTHDHSVQSARLK